MRCAVVKEASWAEPPKARVACCHPTIRMLLWLHHGNEAWVLAGVLLQPGWWLFAQHAHRARENGVVRCREMSRGVNRCSSRQILARVSRYDGRLMYGDYLQSLRFSADNFARFLVILCHMSPQRRGLDYTPPQRSSANQVIFCVPTCRS